LLRRIALFRLELSEAEKAASPAIARVRQVAAHAITKAYTQGTSPSPVPPAPRPAASEESMSRKVRLVAPGGSERRGEDFEEF
jgi:hypothetical protein